MPRKRFAPILRSFLRELARRTDTGWLHGHHVPRAAAELRAVLAVVAAVTGPEGVTPENCWGYDPKTKRCRCQLHRAIERARALVQQKSRPTRRRT